MTYGQPYQDLFQKSLQDWESESQRYRELVQQGYKQIEQLSKEFEATTKPTMGATWVPEWFTKYPVLKDIGYAGWGPWSRSGIQAKVKTRMQEAQVQFETNDFFTRLYGEVPAYIAGIKSTSVDDILAMLAPPSSMSPEDVTKVKDTIRGMINTIGARGQPEMAEEAEQPELPELVPPEEKPPLEMKGLHQLTKEEIRKTLLYPTLPESVLTDEQWKKVLFESGQTEQEGEVIDLAKQAEEIAKEWQDRTNQLNAFKQGIAEMPDYKITDALKEAIVQPGLAMVDLLNLYYEHVSQPLSGLTYKYLVPDIEAKYQELRKTENWYDAYRHAWQEWDSNWFLKYMVMETIIDPTTYIGWGLATKVARPIPYVGRLVGAFERGATQVFELPFDAIKAGWQLIPKTVAQRALTAQHLAGQITERYLTKDTGKFFNQITMKDWKTSVDKAIAFVQTKGGVQSEEPVAQFGRELLKHKPWNEKSVKSMASTIGSDLDITRETIENVDNIFEDFFTFRTISVDEASVKIATNVLGVATDDAKKLVQRILERRASQIIREAESFAESKTVYGAMKELMSRNFKTHIAIEDSAAYLSRMGKGAYHTVLTDIGIRTQAIWKNYIDKLVIKPFAQAYLAFGMYGPMNVIEDYFRSALGGVTPRRMTNEEFTRMATGLTFDPDLHNTGISEMLGYLRTGVGEPARNNWVLTLGSLPLSLPTYAITRGKITPQAFARKAYEAVVMMPGAFGMDVRRNFIAKRYTQILAEKGGDQAKALVGVLKHFSGTNHKSINKEVDRFVTQMALQGNPDLIRQGEDIFTRLNIRRQEVRGILQNYPGLPNTVRQHILDSFNNAELFGEVPRKGMKVRDAKGKWMSPLDSINNTIKESNDLMVDEFLKGGEFATQQFEDLAKVLTELEVRNPQQMAELLRSVNTMSDMYGATPRQVLAQATIKSRGLPFEQREVVLNKSYQDIYNLMDKAGVSIDKVIGKIKLSLAESRVVPNSWDNLMTFMDKLPAKYQGAFSDVLEFLDGYSQLAIKGLEFPDEAVDVLFNTARTEFPNMPEVMIAIDEPARVNKVIAIDKFVKDIHTAVVLDKFESIPGKWLRGKIAIPDEDMVKFIVHFRNILDDLAEGRVKSFNVFSRNHIDSTKQLLDVLTTKRDYVQEFRSQNIALRQEIFAGASKQDLKLPDFWNDFYRRMDADYTKFEDKIAELDGMMVIANRAVDKAGGITRTRPPIVVQGRPLAPQDVANLMGVRGDDITRALLDAQVAQSSKPHFVQYVLAHIEPNDVGFTKEAIEGIYDQIALSLHIKPETLSWVTSKQMELEAVRRELHELWNSKYLPQEEVDAIHKYLDEMANNVESVTKAPGFTEDYDKLRQSAMDEAHKWYYKEYVDYTHANVVDAMMKMVYPYWTYESQRWFWLPRSFIRHPVVATELGRYQNNSDGGYVHIPGTSVDINPFRGTVFGTLTTRLVRRDYPEYYDSLEFAGGYVEFMDFLSRYGFYPGAHMGIPLALLGGRESQFGEVLPASYKSVLDGMVALFPKSESMQAISQGIFNDRFRDYLTIREVDRRGGNGTLIFSKIKTNKVLTEEEEAIWAESRSEVSLYSAGFEQFGLFRMRSDEQYQMYQNAAKAIEEITGYTPDQQDWLRDHGYRLWDMVGGLSPTEQQVLEELNYFKWAGSTRPLLPGRQQEVLNQIELAWDDVRRYTESNLEVKLQLQRDFMNGLIGPRDYTGQLTSLYIKQREYITRKVEENPLMDLDNRKDYYKEYNIPQPVLHPMEEMLNLYFNIELEETTDPETGEKINDWDKFWAMRDAIEVAIPDNMRQEWTDYISRNSTRAEELRRLVNDRYTKRYNDVWQAVIETYNANEQSLIKEYLYLERTGQKLDRQQAIQDITTASGNKLVSDFRSNVTEARKALRYANPHLDAWLFYWGRTSSFLTPQAEVIYGQIARDTGRSI